MRCSNQGELAWLLQCLTSTQRPKYQVRSIGRTTRTLGGRKPRRYGRGNRLAAAHNAGAADRSAQKRIGKPQSFIAKVERGERYLDVVEFSAIARIIGLSADKVIAAVAKKAQSAQNIASNGGRVRSGCYRAVKAIVSP